MDALEHTYIRLQIGIKIYFTSNLTCYKMPEFSKTWADFKVIASMKGKYVSYIYRTSFIHCYQSQGNFFTELQIQSPIFRQQSLQSSSFK